MASKTVSSTVTELYIRVALSAARGGSPATELRRTLVVPTGVHLLQGPRAAPSGPALPLPIPAPGGCPRDAWVRAPSPLGAELASRSSRRLGRRSPAEELRKAPGWRSQRWPGGVQAMERTVEPWGPDLHGPEDREPLRGARTGLGSENAQLSQPDEFEHTPQEDDLGFKEEEDLAPDHEVGNASLKPEGIKTWDDLWIQREGPGKPHTRDRSPRLLGEPRWGQTSDRAAVPPLTPRSPSHSGDGPFGLPGLEPEPGGPQAGEPPPPLAGDKPHKCPECGKGFRRSSDLVKHHRVHTGEKPYLCPECGKGFADSSARVKHLRTHRGERARPPPPSTLLKPHNPPGPATMAPQVRVQAQPSGPSQPHVCGFCGKEFPRSSDLVKHRRTHTGEKPYKCAECGKGFGDSSARIKHQRGHLGLRPFGMGDGAIYTIASSATLKKRKHATAWSGGGVFSERCCYGDRYREKCGRLVWRGASERPRPEQERTWPISGGAEAPGCSGDLRAGHRRRVLKDNKMPGEQQTEEEEEEEEEMKEEMVLLVKGEEDEGEKYEVVKLKIPMDKEVPREAPAPSVDPARPHACPDCGRAFARRSTLAKHARTHTGERPFACTECGRRFSQKSALTKHGRTHTGERPYECPECDKRFSAASNLRQHRRRHTGEKPYACAHCGRRFAQSSNYAQHLRVHTGEKPYACPDCGRAFGGSSCLARHRRTHTGERPYACADCGTRFAQSSALAKHRRVHTGEKPHRCAVCGRRFGHRSNLAEHARTHTGERPYPCAECGRRFRLSSHFIRHRRAHLRRRLYICAGCGRDFKLSPGATAATATERCPECEGS
ncbi:hypothetical protein MUG91_G83n102 [Manis pentadactyla]|nr:hypothetical protein MUG91_G83n102 [Manis pentadactyla]